MKVKILSFLAAVCIAGSASAAVTLSGTALLNAPGLVAGQNAYYAVGLPGAEMIESANLGGPISFNDAPDVLGVGGNTVANVFGSLALGAGANFDQNPVAGQQFSVIVFNSSPLGQAVVGDTYLWWTDPAWIVPAADGLYAFDSELPQLSGANTGSGEVVPEPSTYAMLAGALALVAVMIRRRK